jgi:ABC-type sugar transport system ATPase subunit
MPDTPLQSQAVPPLLRVSAISKTFPGLRALERVSLDVDAGEIVAVVGQNGSGKSTLVKILAGVYEPDRGGSIEVRDAGGSLLSGAAAHDELSFIHQDLGLIGMLSTIENLDLGRRHRSRLYRPSPVRRERRAARRLIERFGASFDVGVPVATLSAAERTIVAIARALDGWSRPDRVLVLDEPTAALHGEEVTTLFSAVRRVAAEGAGVIFISHRLDEVIDLADRVIVLRDGRLVANARRGEYHHDELVRMIAGRELAAVARSGGEAGEVALAARGVSGGAVQSVDLDLHAGEVLGVTGLLGSGREQLAGMLFGSAPRRGEVRICGAPLRPVDPRSAIRLGIGYVPADRKREGAVMTMSARENLTLPRLRTLRRRGGYLDRRAERVETNEWARTVDLRPRNAEQMLAQYSGGNQQKVVLAKWLRNEPRVLLLDEPTQGVDVGAKSAIYELIAQAARGGAAVLVSSSDSKELASICDRVLVMRDGVVGSQVPRGELTEARLVIECLGGGAAQAPLEPLGGAPGGDGDAQSEPPRAVGPAASGGAAHEQAGQ